MAVRRAASPPTVVRLKAAGRNYSKKDTNKKKGSDGVPIEIGWTPKNTPLPCLSSHQAILGNHS
uniref:Uncharacterized protein n=1 Tax=Manihot esculenta TaxID=3983 RepID=A0A2C9VTT1_MANES